MTRLARVDSSTLTDDSGDLDDLCGDGNVDWFLAKAGNLVRDVETGEAAAAR